MVQLGQEEELYKIGRRTLGGAGTQNAGLAFGGDPSGITTSCCTETYNGTSWTVASAMSTPRSAAGGAGTQNAALSIAGLSRPSGTNLIIATTEEYNGTSWSTGGALATARYYLGSSGEQDAGLAFGGYNASFTIITCTEEYNGSSWSAGVSMNIAKDRLGGSGTSVSTIAVGGRTGGSGFTNTTEEFTGPVTTYTPKKTFDYDDTTGDTTISGSSNFTGSMDVSGSAIISTSLPGGGTSSWSTGGALSQARYSLGGAGTQTAGLAFGGKGEVLGSAQYLTCTEEYNGTCLVRWRSDGGSKTSF